jgi:hypothetical protein
MAFQPTQLLTNIANAIDEFERYFDEKLEVAKIGVHDTFISIPPPKGYSEAHHKELEKRYTKVGWYMVVYGSSGGHIRFYAKC